MVDNFIRTWLDITLEDQRVDHDGLGETVGRCLGVLYADGGMVGSCDSEWIHHTMNVLVGLFRRHGLEANVIKSLTITCHPGALRAGMFEEDMPLKCTGAGDLYQVRIQRRIPYPECGVHITMVSMTAHRRRMHGTEPAINCICLPVSQTVHQPQVYNVRFPQLPPF